MFKKLLALFSLFTLLLLTPFVVAVETGGQATLEAGLVHRAKVLPVGNNADGIAVSSILSIVTGKRGEDLMQLCGDRERLKSRLRSLVKYDLCQGVGAVLDSCYYANSVCSNLRDNNGCSVSPSEALSRCIDSAKAQAGENRASVSTFEAALSGRCEQACDEGIRIRGLKPSSAIQRECSAVGFEYRSLGPYAACISTGEHPNLPITIEQAEEIGVEFPEEELTEEPEAEMEIRENGVEEELTEEPLLEIEENPLDELSEGTEEELNDSACDEPIASCSEGYDLTSSVVDGCAVNQCVRVTTLPIAAVCTDNIDNGNNAAIRGTTIAISASNVRTEKTDACKSATSLLEYYCTGATLTTAVASCPNGCANGACPAPSGATQSSGAAGSSSTTSANAICADTDGGVAPLVQGTVTLTPSTTSADYCFNSTRLIEYSCASTTASKATITGVTCSSTTHCSNGACVSNFVGSSSSDTTTSKNTATNPSSGTSGTTSSTTSGTTSSTVTYSCVDSDSGVTSTAPGTVTITPSTGSPVSTADSCTDSTHVLEYSCASTTASTASSEILACASDQTCSAGRCGSSTSSSTGKLITPLTIRIIAVPSVLSAFAVGDEDDAADVLPSVSAASERCVDNCKALLRAEVWGSYGDENIAKECKKEVNGNAGLVKKFCEQGDPEEVYNECSAYVESTCGLAVPAFEKCQELSRDKEKVIDLLADTVEDKCEAVKLGLEESQVDWSKFSASSAVVGQGAEETLIKSRVSIEKSLKSNVFDEASRIVCLRYGAEKEAAAKCKNSVDKIKASIDILEQLKVQSDEADQTPINAVIDKLTPQLGQWQERCAVKDKKAAGICGGTI